MNSKKRFLCLLLALVLSVSVCLIPAGATDVQEKDPIVFVHGLLGWGERDGINAIMPYWGMTTGSITEYLGNKGYECYAASVGPLSSAWDRACELYAQLTGTTVDYGAKHAEAYGHARYGVTYDKPLFEGWGSTRAVNLVGHSFGGATTRLFLDILSAGCQEEVEAAKAAGTEPSPFFEGGKSSWVHSLTAIAAPHNGTTFIESNSDFTALAADLFTNMAKSLGISKFKGVYDFQLEHFGIYKDSNETMIETLNRVLKSDFLSHNDNAFLDLTIDKALDINDDIEIQPNVYYFSYAGDQTITDIRTGNHTPSPAMWPLFWPGSINMGKYYDQTTAGGVSIDKSWLPNDGMVNTVSALYPINHSLQCLTKNNQQGYTNCDGYTHADYQPGIWYVMPVQDCDHLQFIGGILNYSIVKTRLLYLNIMKDIDSTYNGITPPPDINVDQEFPFTDVSPDRWSYDDINHLYQLGIVNGMTATTFAPAANVTRAQFVKMIAGLANADIENEANSGFQDVPDNAWYAPYVAWAVKNGIVMGVSETEFCPDANISRQDMAVMLYRYTKSAGIQLSTEYDAVAFTDQALISGYAVEAVTALQQAGILNGFANGNGTYSYHPQDFATREQACKVLCAV